MLITARDSDNYPKIVEIVADPSGRLITISHEHNKAHLGELFTSGYYVSGVANNASIEILFKTSTDYVHFYSKITAGGDAELRIFESPTIAVDGTALTPVNHLRDSTKTPLSTVFHTPTTTADGTQLDGTEYFPGGTGGLSPGAVDRVGLEQFILAPNTNYLMRLTNIAGVASGLDIKLAFYETPKV